ncbi:MULTISPECIES: MupG family TIM beta-alpha barrel fold protein [Metabacillus]|uniref:MupG family TIM beta-alpha barrel fold protein n=1 Tax=Metabacillus hrfriensis TaxID=3048891 RepID=A0ACD4RFY4_9BACI|nr:MULTISPECIES: MupG family TIM beta-alpha barrel fold protein [Metabacillus]UAL53802.1 MupG family TIM beta-alpha barrel fold protein [Metabacillus dongyingensis]UOK59217.1 MupG family TIM beta-alpha barrel fold protein [Bacillus sp. OVS6]WHZ59358.1 MupG family TIM beta-alpha barrel fold protein [Metabacillus sp. CT-WN-B3]
MIGISFYLQDPNAEKQIVHAAKSGVKRAFTSLHIPEEKGSLVQRMSELLKLAESHNMEIHADVSLKTLDHLEISRFEDLSSYGIKGIRLDDGFNYETIKSLSDVFSLSLNASTLTEKELLTVLGSGIKSDRLIAWHNFYPRRETGLDEVFFHKQNQMFKKYGIPIAAFIPGTETKRGPLFDGLPTLEKHRGINPYAAGVEMLQQVDEVFIGDPGTEDELLENLSIYENQNILIMNVISSTFKSGTYQFRPDASRDVFRLQGTRRTSEVVPENTIGRQIGMITMDNDGYGRYKGEIQICRRDLEADERVNVIGHVSSEDLPLLDLAMPGQKVKLVVS